MHDKLKEQTRKLSASLTNYFLGNVTTKTFDFKISIVAAIIVTI